MNYKELYKIQNDKLIRNTENKITYTDKDGIKRVKTNPTIRDFANVGIKPLIVGEAPECNHDTQILKEKIVEREECFVVQYEIQEIMEV